MPRSPNPEPSRRHTRAAGAAAERRVRLHFRVRGYRVLDANAWAGGNEVDLVVRRGRRLLFCEVKAKRGDAYGDPLEMIGEEKERRVRRAAEAWLAARPALEDLEVELVGVAVRGRRIEVVPLG